MTWHAADEIVVVGDALDGGEVVDRVGSCDYNRTNVLPRMGRWHVATSA